MMMLIMMMIVCSLISRAVARSSRAFFYHTVRYGLQIIRPADAGEEVDEGGGEVRAIVAQFGCLIVPWKYMMVIVPALAESANADAIAIGGANGAATKIQTCFPYRLYASLRLRFTLK